MCNHKLFSEYLFGEEVHCIERYTVDYIDCVLFKTRVAFILGSEPHARGRRIETEEARQNYLVPHVWEAT